MTLDEFRIELEGEMKWAGSLLAEIEGIEYSAEVESNGSYLFGVVMLANPGMAEDEKIYISLEADMDIDNNVDREDFEKARAAFRTRINGIYETLTGVNDPASALVGIAKEIDAELDKEGMQCMRNLGRNAAFLMKSISLGRAEFGLPEVERGARTNFIR